MPINPFRRFQTKCDFRSSKGTTETRIATFNLFDVVQWETVDNAFSGFDDDVKRTQILTDKDGMFCRVAYEDFDKLMMKFHYEAMLLDNRSMEAPKKKVMQSYKGDMMFIFNRDNFNIACCAFPAGMRTRFERGFVTESEIFENLLYSGNCSFN